MVIFTGGKFRKNVGEIFHMGIIFTMFTILPFLFSHRGNLWEEHNNVKNTVQKLMPRENVNVYSIVACIPFT